MPDTDGPPQKEEIKALTSDRRSFLGAPATGTVILLLRRRAHSQEPDGAADWRARTYSVGRRIAVASSSKEATEAALWALSQGGNAASAYLAAAVTQTVFEPAITHALSGGVVSDGILRASEQRAANSPEGRKIWTDKDGRFLRTGAKLVQTGLVRTLKAVAKGGSKAFCEGDFARAYVKRCRADGGRLTVKDMKGWRNRARTASCDLEGIYRGHQVCAPQAGLLIYALHLNEALDLFVLRSPLREVRIDDLFNTCFLVVRDENGNCAWGTHSINTPQSFGAGIVVQGVYAAYVIDRGHVKGNGATAAGISTGYALYRDGKPRVIVGSPESGFVHGPYQYGTGVIEW